MLFRRVTLTLTAFVPRRNLSKKLGVIGVPFAKGQHINGVETGPTALRQSGLLEDIGKYRK